MASRPGRTLRRHVVTTEGGIDLNRRAVQGRIGIPHHRPAFPALAGAGRTSPRRAGKRWTPTASAVRNSPANLLASRERHADRLVRNQRQAAACAPPHLSPALSARGRRGRTRRHRRLRSPSSLRLPPLARSARPTGSDSFLRRDLPGLSGIKWDKWDSPGRAAQSRGATQ